MSTFNFRNHTLRTIELDGQPWFIAIDVCRCLGLDLAKGANNHTRRLDSDEQRLITPSQIRGLRGTGAAAVSESGLYKLIMRSDKAEAVEFQNWVTREVLPAIRRTGGYLLNEHARETAHADNKEAMPFPAEFLEVFKKQSEVVDRLVSLVEALVAHGGKTPAAGEPAVEDYTPTFDKDFYLARDVVLKLRKAGAMPTAKEVHAATVKVGQELSVLSRQMNAPYKMVRRGEYDTRVYPRAVIEAYAAS